METLNGMVVPIITPLTPDLRLDKDALVRHLKRLESLWVESVIVLGMTGECLTLDMDVKKDVIFNTLAAFDGNVLVGIGDKNADNSVAIAAYAKELDATGILVPPAYDGDGSGISMAKHYKKVAGQCEGMHRMIYHNPHVFPGIHLDFFRENARSFDSVKDSSGDPVYFGQLLGFREYVNECNKFGVFQGDEKLLWLSMEQGADGYVSSTANVNPHACRTAWTSIECQAELSEMHDTIYPGGKMSRGLNMRLAALTCAAQRTLSKQTSHQKKRQR